MTNDETATRLELCPGLAGSGVPFMNVVHRTDPVFGMDEAMGVSMDLFNVMGVLREKGCLREQ
jgi:hypothetical protein